MNEPCFNMRQPGWVVEQRAGRVLEDVMPADRLGAAEHEALSEEDLTEACRRLQPPSGR